MDAYTATEATLFPDFIPYLYPNLLTKETPMDDMTHLYNELNFQYNGYADAVATRGMLMTLGKMLFKVSKQIEDSDMAACDLLNLIGLDEGTDTGALPLYTSHKQVKAAKIIDMKVYSDHSAALFFEEGVNAISVEPAYVRKHAPHAGGYYVVYKDGYESFSPAKAFEEGYTLAEIIGD